MFMEPIYFRNGMGYHSTSFSMFYITRLEIWKKKYYRNNYILYFY